METIPSIYQIQYIPQWSRIHPKIRQSILNKGSLANQPIKMPFPKGCKQGDDCFNCTINCGSSISCWQCSVKNCTWTPPCIGESNHE